MDKTVFLTAEAQRDIAAIKEYISKNNPAVAVKIAGRLYDETDKLADNPQKGVALSAKFGIQTDLRMWIVSPNLILYKIVNDKIIVTRVLDERRDYLVTLGLAERKDDGDI
jgi:plasmid stabilization system protein ParE